MEPTGAFNYADYCRAMQREKVPSVTTAASTVAAPSEAATQPSEDNDHIYSYVSMREPDPAKDAQPIAYAYYPQYAYPHATQQAPAPVAYAYPTAEESIRAYASHKSAKPVATRAPTPAPAHVAQPAVYYTQPAVAYAATPYAYAMPNYPVPVHGTVAFKTTVTENEKPKAEKAGRVWVGRTKKEVDEDNIKIAIAEGIYQPNDMVPKNAKPDQLFWVIELDGSNTLRSFQAIESGALGKGVWKVDPRYGNAYFVRAKEEKEKK